MNPFRDYPSIKAEADEAIGKLASSGVLDIVLPAREHIFRAFALCPLEAARVVVIGQDPYPNPDHAMGLAFSVPASAKTPASLRNIFKEMVSDIGSCPGSGDLSGWAGQGVLLANTALTVMPGEPGSHRSIWERFTDSWVSTLGASDRPLVWVLWGKHAQSFKHRIGSHHIVIESAHPSPLAVRHGFFGSKPFSRVNQALSSLGQEEVDWCGACFG